MVERGRPRAGARVQQVGPGRRGPPATPGERGRARAGPRAPGRRGSTSPRRPAAASTGWRPALRTALASWEQRVPTGRLNACLGDARRGDAAAGAQRQAAEDPVRHPGRHPAADGSCCSPAGSSRRATDGSSSAGCARSSASPVRPIEISCGCARSASAPRDGHGARPRSCARGKVCVRCAARRWQGSRDVAQLGSALDWGSRGRRFKSCRPDREGTQLVPGGTNQSTTTCSSGVDGKPHGPYSTGNTPAVGWASVIIDFAGRGGLSGVELMGPHAATGRRCVSL